MRILILDSYYSAFVGPFYEQNPNLAGLAYDEQWRTLMDQCFGTADFYSENLNRLGHEAREVVTNCEPLQRRWAWENGIKLDQPRWVLGRRAGVIPWPRQLPPRDWATEVLIRQIKKFSPDVLYIQEMNSFSAAFLREVKPFVKLVVGQIAYPVNPGADFREYDLILSSFPHYVSRFRDDGLTSEYLKLSFDPRVLSRLDRRKNYDAVFVGSLSIDHAERIEFLERVASLQPLEVWGPGSDSLRPDSPLRQQSHGNAWALDMYQVLGQARVSLNHHIDAAGPYANNMRLYEATGVGSLLITDWKVNLDEIFETGKEVVAYHTPEECAELITYYLEHSEEREAIASAGQKRTLSEHTYYGRMQELVEILERRLSSKRAG